MDKLETISTSRPTETQSKMDLAHILSEREKDDQRFYPNKNPPASISSQKQQQNVTLTTYQEQLVQQFISLKPEQREQLQAQDPDYYNILLQYTFQKYPNLNPEPSPSQSSQNETTTKTMTHSTMDNSDYPTMAFSTTSPPQLQPSSSSTSNGNDVSIPSEKETPIIETPSTNTDISSNNEIQHHSILVDFRKDLIDLDEYGYYTFQCPSSWKKAREAKIEWVMLPHQGDMEREPYFYISSPQFPSSYETTWKGKQRSFSHILFPSSTNHQYTFCYPIQKNFIPIHQTNGSNYCKIAFSSGLLEPLLLSKINIIGIRSEPLNSSSKNKERPFTFRTQDLHYLMVGDTVRVTVFYSSGWTSVFLVTVEQVLSDTSFRGTSEIDVEEMKSIYLERRRIPVTLLLHYTT